MNSMINQPQGVINRTILRFISSNNWDFQEIKSYIKEKYRIALSDAVLRRRIAQVKKLQEV